MQSIIVMDTPPIPKSDVEIHIANGLKATFKRLITQALLVQYWSVTRLGRYKVSIVQYLFTELFPANHARQRRLSLTAAATAVCTAVVSTTSTTAVAVSIADTASAATALVLAAAASWCVCTARHYCKRPDTLLLAFHLQYSTLR